MLALRTVTCSARRAVESEALIDGAVLHCQHSCRGIRGAGSAKLPRDGVAVAIRGRQLCITFGLALSVLQECLSLNARAPATMR